MAPLNALSSPPPPPPLIQLYSLCSSSFLPQGHVYLNGKLLEKKARSLTRGDKVDIIQEIDDIANTKTVIRIVVMEIAKVPGKRVKMEVEVWKPGICIKETA